MVLRFCMGKWTKMYITIFPFMASFSRKHVKFERILDFKVSHGRRSMSRFSLFRINCVMRCVFACSFSFLFAFRESWIASSRVDLSSTSFKYTRHVDKFHFHVNETSYERSLFEISSTCFSYCCNAALCCCWLFYDRWDSLYGALMPGQTRINV